MVRLAVRLCTIRRQPMFTFQTKYCGSEWLTSGKRFLTHDEARKAAVEWVDVLLMNDEEVSVRVIKIDDSL